MMTADRRPGPRLVGLMTLALLLATRAPGEEPACADPCGTAECPGATAFPVTPFPPVGLSTFAPTGPGFYSLRDYVEGVYREAPPKYPYPRFGFIQPSFFDMSWAYLDKPDNEEHDLFDCLKRIPLGDCLRFTTGGDFRIRYASEDASRLTNTDNTYTLVRTRVYGDLTYGDRFRLYGEFLDAHSFGEELVPLPIDVNRSDMLNLFGEVKLGEVRDAPLYARVGRQELLYGSQRLISTLDWANTRRTFQGAKLYRHGEKFDVDLFCVQPVVPDPSEFDSVDNNVIFSGLWTTWRPEKGHNIDLYYLNLDRAGSGPTRLGVPSGPFNVHTLGGRYFARTEKGWLWDVEADLQLGSKRGESILAGAATAGFGRVFADCRMSPQLWLYYDYATGDGSPDQLNTARTFNQLFPFGHYYFGYIDAVGRQNIHDWNLQATIYPTKWITAFAQYHVFRLAESRDALYNAAGVPIRRDPTGAAGTDVGQEIDLVVNFHLTKHQDIYVNYSHLFIGDYLRRTGSTRSPDYVYVQYSFRW